MKLSGCSDAYFLLHTACGISILSIPYGIKCFGILYGISLVLLCGCFSFLALSIQLQVIRYIPGKAASFFVLSEMIHHRLGLLFDLSIAIKSIGVCISFMIIIGDLLPKVMKEYTNNEFIINRIVAITLVKVCVIAPLCFIKNSRLSKYSHAISMMTIIYTSGFIVYQFVNPSEEVASLKGTVDFYKPVNQQGKLLIEILPIFIFAFTAHHNLFYVMNNNDKIWQQNFKSVMIIYTVIAFMIYVAICSCGYLTFGDMVSGNIMTIYPNTFTSTIGRISIIICIILTFPLQFQPAIAAIHRITYTVIYGDYIAPSDKTDATISDIIESELTPLITNEGLIVPVEELIEEGSTKQSLFNTLGNKRVTFLTIILLIVIYMLSLYIRNLVDILAFIGATGSTVITFILPGMFGFYLIGAEYDSCCANIPLEKALFRYASLALIVCGISVTASYFFVCIYILIS